MAPQTNVLGKTLIIVNPAAQSGAAGAVAERLQRFLSLYLHGANSFNVVRTQRPRHAIELAATARGYRTVLALGGDGIIHEVACGLMRIEPRLRPQLGIVPVGSGNDYARTLGIPESSHDNALAQLLSCRPKPMDIGRITFEEHRGEASHVEHFMQSFSFGLDAAVAHDTTERRKRTKLTGTMLYTASGLSVFGAHYHESPATVLIDGAAPERLRILLMAIQIGPTYGSGYKICPDANPTDGLFDICYACGPIPRAVAIPLLLAAKGGHHTKFPCVHLTRARQIELTFEADDYAIQADGEVVRARHAIVETLPGALQVLQPV